MLELEMKMTANPFAFGENGDRTEGVRFRFRDWDYTHEQTLMLKSNGAPRDDVHRDPLYALQGVPDGTRVKCHFEPFQQRQQDQRDGSRDRVRDVIGLRLVKVVAPESNGKGS